MHGIADCQMLTGQFGFVLHTVGSLGWVPTRQMTRIRRPTKDKGQKEVKDDVCLWTRMPLLELLQQQSPREYTLASCLRTVVGDASTQTNHVYCN